jgi:putative endonuclease
MTYGNIEKGKKAEDLAITFLQKQGLLLLTRNYRCKLGEIDLIMKERSCLVFVEVRFRNNRTYGMSIETISISKQKRMIHTALYFLKSHHLLDKIPCRFDVVAIQKMEGKNTIEWVKNAFNIETF